MNRNRFRLALEKLRAGQWERFEELAAEFMVDEFPQLRTTASQSGDGGRDGKLAILGQEDQVALQYSLQEDWKSKVADTISRVTTTFPEVRELVFVTNQVIGAAGDDIERKARDRHRIFLDLRDRNWFLERANTTPARRAAAESLASEIADSYLASEGVLDGKAQALTSTESRAACVYLALQWEDDTREKGLTRVCFEALVRSVLRGTDPDRRLGRSHIRLGVRDLLPAHPEAVVDRHTDAALSKLTKRYIRHYRQVDEFCLTFEERRRIADRLADIEASDAVLISELAELVAATCEELPGDSPDDLERLTALARLTLDQTLWRRGEVFAAAVSSGDLGIEYPELADTAAAVARDAQLPSRVVESRIARILAASTEAALADPSETVQAYLRAFADAYTLFAFMRETPDVQAAMVKMFSTGDIWLDTSVVLPLFAEELLDSAEGRLYSNLLKATREAGLNLYVTGGVVEEIYSHFKRCEAYARRATGTWDGRVPFLAAAFALTGRSLTELPSWLVRFRGDERPEDDIADYMAEEFGIQRQDLQQAAEEAPIELRAAVQEIWHEAHERRRASGASSSDPMITHRLVDHDVENYLGVARRRRGERESPFGYTSWWLTLDRVAPGVKAKLALQLPASDVPASPVMTPDFLANYLAVGPVRNKLARSTEAALPLAISDLTPLDLLPADLLDAAEETRTKLEDMPAHVVRREVRDLLERGRRRAGPLAQGGLGQLMDNLRGLISTEE